ncbi:serine/threonine protein kinase [bacterium]|nr:serine/threonine protein kinase [bacterium]
MLFGFEQRRFWLKSMDEFVEFARLEAAVAILPGAPGRPFKLAEKRDPDQILADQYPQLVALAPHLRRPASLIDDQQVWLLVPLLVEDANRGVLAGVRGHVKPFSLNDLQAALTMSERLTLQLAGLQGQAQPLPAREEPASYSVLVGERYARGLKLVEGRFSTIYGGYDQQAQMPVLLRRLEGGAHNKEARQHLLREARFLSRLTNPCLPRFLATVDDSSGLYLILEAFSGTTLEQRLERSRGALEYQTLDQISQQLISALEFLHGQVPPLIHRDLRPDTIMTTPQGVIKLLDFGLARLKDTPGDPRQTQFRGQGHPVYACPEQLQGQPSQPDHDLYSVGTLLYHLACGDIPPRSVDRWEGSANEIPLAELRPDLPAEWCSRVDWMRKPHSSERPRSVSELKR